MIGQSQTITADITPDGQFSKDNLRSGLYGLEITAQGHLPIYRVLRVNVGANELETFDLIHESQSSSAVTLNGQVLNAEGNPLTDVVVQVFKLPNLDPFATTISDDTGRFALQASKFDQYQIQFQHPTSRTLVIEPVVWNEDLQYFVYQNNQITAQLEEFELNGSIEVVVTLNSTWVDERQSEFDILLIDNESHQTTSAIANRTSAFFTDLKTGTYLVSLRREGFLPIEQRVELSPQNPQIILNFDTELVDLAAAGLNLDGMIISDQDLRSLDTIRGANLSGAQIRGDREGNTTADLIERDLSPGRYVIVVGSYTQNSSIGSLYTLSID